MTVATVRILTLTILTFLMAHLAAVTARPAAAPPGVCDRLCQNVTFMRICGTGYIEYEKKDCKWCPNLNNSECIDGVNKPCTQYMLNANRFRPARKGTPLCNCNPGIQSTEATAVDDVAPVWLQSNWWTCDGKPPS